MLIMILILIPAADPHPDLDSDPVSDSDPYTDLDSIIYNLKLIQIFIQYCVEAA
jgi:hypothetical protein